MPEKPEVMTVVKNLIPRIVGKRITGCNVYWDNIIASPTTDEFKKKIIVIGNESNGVSKEIQDIADEKAKIPMIGKTESLNASVAAGIVMYEYVRQKLNK